MYYLIISFALTFTPCKFEAILTEEIELPQRVKAKGKPSGKTPYYAKFF